MATFDPPANDTTTTNGIHEEKPLKIAIIGAGIGGLSAAITLRQQNHDVYLYESSSFAKELGAAIHLPPNTTGVLDRMGVFPEETGANECRFMSMYGADGTVNSKIPVWKFNQIWQHKWLLSHRVKLHDRLKQVALSETGKGTAKLLLASPVATCDPETGSLTLKDGSTVSFDAIIGADGVHSITRKYVQDEKAFSSGKSAFRFLIQKSKVMEDPETAKMIGNDGEMAMVFARDRRIVMYPTSDNSLFNFVCIHPESETAHTASGDWNNDASLELLDKTFENFSPEWRALLNKAEPGSLKAWKLLDMKVLDSWTNQKLALLGDAAHPFLPHQGQGGGCAIEDAVALGTVMEEGIKPSDVPTRLKLYERIRKTRADQIQEYTRWAGRDLKPGEPQVPMMEYTNYNFGHDEFDNSAQQLRAWKFGRSGANFGYVPTAMSELAGEAAMKQHLSSAQKVVSTATVRFQTSRTRLQNFFPLSSISWKFASPGTVAYASWRLVTTNTDSSVQNSLSLVLHGVKHAESGFEGDYLPVTFKNDADDVVNDVMLGKPAAFCDIQVSRNSSSFNVEASKQGQVWFKMSINELTSAVTPATPEAAATESPSVAYSRLAGTVGKEQCAILETTEADTTSASIHLSAKAEVTFVPITTRANAALLQEMVVRCSELPIVRVLEATVKIS